MRESIFKLLDKTLGTQGSHMPEEYTSRNDVIAQCINVLVTEKTLISGMTLDETMEVIQLWITEFYDNRAR